MDVSMEFQQVFISHCVRTMGPVAVRLNELLRNKGGFSTFICTQMMPGDQFRNSIIANASNCEMMVVFLDVAWALSGECQAEFNCAYSCYNKRKAPIIVPVVVGGFEWIDPRVYYQAFALTANFQCLSLRSEKVNEQCDQVLHQVLAKCRQALMPSLAASLKDSPDSQVVLKEATVISCKQDVSSSSTQVDSVIKNFITCEICQDIFKDPRLLPCNHTFCLKCLIEWKKTVASESAEAEFLNEFTCPKCRITCHVEVEALPSDFKANQLIDAYEESQTLQGNEPKESKPQPSASESGKLSELEVWFSKNSIPSEAQKILMEEGYEFLDIVLELKSKDLDALSGLKPGHKAKLIKCIESSQSLPANILDTPESKRLETIYDDRVLTTGTIPGDTLKFWAAFGEKEREHVISELKQFAVKLNGSKDVPDEIKADKLHKLAMVFCDVGLYADAEKFAIDSMSLAKSKSAAYFTTNVLLLYAVMNRIKQGSKFVSKNELEDWKGQLAKCDDAIKKGGKILPNEVKIKALIMKLFALRAIKARDKTFTYDVSALMTFASGMSKKLPDKGLHAEYLMTEALLDNMSKKPSVDNRIKKLLEARKLCHETYGEFSTLMSRIYYNLAGAFEELSKIDLAYECFRRVWLIDMQLFGIHHPETKKSTGVMEEKVYSDIAKSKGDSLPGEDNLGTMDLNFELRLKPVFEYQK